MLEVLANCDKICCTCSKTEQQECIGEQKSVLHSLVLVVKEVLSHLIELTTGKPPEPITEKEIKEIYS